MASGDTLCAIPAGAFVGAGTNRATLDAVLHGTGQSIVVMDFDSAQTEEAITAHPATMPGQYDGTSALTVAIRGAMDSANTGTKQVRLDVRVSRLNAGQALNADGFASALSVSAVVDNAANEVFEATINFTNAQFDGVQPNEDFLVHVQRDHDHADDDAVGDYQMLTVEVREQ